MLAFVVVMLASACGDSYQMPQIEGLAVYVDTVNEMSIKYPKNWDIVRNDARSQRSITFVPNKRNSTLDNYQKYSVESLPGAYIKFSSLALDSANTLESKIEKHRQHLKEVINLKETKETIDGMPGVKLSYSFPLNHVEDTMRGFRYFAQADSQTATFLLVECFGGSYKTYKKDIDEIIASVKLAHTPAPKVFVRDSTVQDTFEFPTTTMRGTLGGNGISISIPENCTVENVTLGKGVIAAYHFTALRHINVGIRIDIKNAKEVKDNSELKKQAENNKGLYGGKSPKAAKIAGLTAYEFNYSPAGGVSRTVWYVLHNSKIYIITRDMVSQDKDKYQPAIDKAMSTIKFE
jgi:hypothetical protein